PSTMLCPSPISLAVRWKGRSPTRRLESAVTDPAQAQRSLLRTLLSRHQYTAFGRDHGFGSILTPADYQRAVPVREYEGFRPYVQRMVEGEANVLVRDPVQMFTLTSGTTGQSKYIPVTVESETRNANLMRQWLCRLLSDHPKCLNRSIVGIVSPAVEGYTPSGIPYGSLSGRMYQHMPRLIRDAYAVPYSVFEISDYDTRYWAIARFALARNVSFVATPNPSTLQRLASVLAAHGDALIRAIHDGTLGLTQEQSGLASSTFQHLCTRLRPQPHRARTLSNILSKTGVLHPKNCWPHLKVLGCWTGGSVGHQAQRLVEAYGDVSLRDLGYLASEARVTLPVGDRTSSGILDVTLNYCEFIPENATDDSHPPIYLSHELEIGKRYSILVTTPGGLYRYHINDIVEVTGFYHQTPMIAFVRKGKDMSNLTGEKLHVNQLLLAMDTVCQRFDLSIGSVQWVPSVDEMAYHVYVEWLDHRGDRWIQQVMLPALDEALGQLNSEYAQKRASKRLHPICLHRMRDGWAEAVKRRAIAQGGRDIQYKWKVLTPDGNSSPLNQSYEETVIPAVLLPDRT
ncbi:MAG: GH3 auxin-responsive promoter family protein, partial [Leptolyngbyaceae bacterium]|nr:GH3 auxin-responsive promoter family protein [Leptolyngbyaceae bacterium]